MGTGTGQGLRAAGRLINRFNALKTLTLDALSIQLALLLSLGLVRNFRFAEGFYVVLRMYAIPILGISIVLLSWRRLYRINPRYLGAYDILNITFVATVLAISALALDSVYGFPNQGTSVWTFALLFGFLSCSLLAFSRMSRRMAGLRSVFASASSPVTATRICIVGAGDAGEMVIRELSKIEPAEYHVVVFVDDDPRKLGMTIHGVPVVGPVDEIPSICSRNEIDEILIAIPSASGESMRRVYSRCAETKARIRTLPAFSTFVHEGGPILPLVREMDVEDLLRRSSVKSDMAPVARYISGERVLITGGGGSIGSELARQIAGLSPASLVVLGKGENSIFEIDQELRHQNVFQPTPVVCDIRDKQGLSAVFGSQYPSVVFHAAAHKHVPLMEAVPIEAIRNNVFGTLNIAEQATRHGVKKFIFVSTDKAVNPSNVMGATKRVAELIISSFASRSETSFATVRFGNVLGSRGSLLPILRMQIQQGGPITITHPDMTRFFMTIPEAVHLIVQAGAMGERGEVFILDMGDPISIVELAKDMIRLHGLVPGQDIEIKYTGVRPGEKIHEELAFEAEDLSPSGHEKIRMVANSRPVEWDWLREQLNELERLCDSGDAASARSFLMELAWGKAVPPVVQAPQTPAG